jgi:transposase
MYLRHTTITKNGKTRTDWRLVQSVRHGTRVRQVTIAQLGELDEQGRLAARALAERIVGVERQPGLFDDDLPQEPIALVPRELRLERARQFGDVWLAVKLWQALGFDRLLEKRVPPGREDIPWSVMAAVLVTARFGEPASELHLAEDWFRRTTLDDLLGIPVEKVNDDRCYRAWDRLLPHQQALEEHLRHELGTLFQLDYDLLLYDITSTYFEGPAEDNDLARRGHSRDHRPDCKQVCIGLVVTREGYPLGFEIFAGNRHDSMTVTEIVTRMEARFGQANRVWAMDRGMVSEATLDWLRERGSRYLVGTPKNQLRQWERQLVEGEWSRIREGLEVQHCRDGEAREVFIRCRSADRAAKERAMRDRFAERLEAGRNAIRTSCQKRCQSVGAIERRVGRLLQRNSRAGRFYEVRVQADPSGRVVLEWSRRDEERERARRGDGCYVLRSNVTDWSASELWQAYIQLTPAEAAFRIHKDDLQMRPVWHQKSHRVRAHLLVCFLAYVVRKTLEGWMKRAGLGSSVSTVIEELARIQSTDVVIPTVDGREVRMRCIVRPDAAQKTLLDRLGLELPSRRRIPRGGTRM